MNELPPSVNGLTGFEIPGRSIQRGEQLMLTMASAEYFSALRTPLRRGRIWTRPEEMRGARFAVINETMANRYWPAEDPIGRRIRLETLKKFSVFQVDSPGNDRWVEVIGVAGDSRNSGLHEAVAPGIYVPYTVVPWDTVTFMIRSNAAQQAVVAAARRKIAEVNGDQPASLVSTLQDRLRESGWARQQFAASLFSLCAGLALLLATIGLYSAVACSVSRRAREFGLRIALGSSGPRIVAHIFRSNGVTIALGLAAGLALTAVLDRPTAAWTESSLWNATDLPAIVALLALAAMSAVVIPARRAASSNPIALLADSTPA